MVKLGRGKCEQDIGGCITNPVLTDIPSEAVVIQLPYQSTLAWGNTPSYRIIRALRARSPAKVRKEAPRAGPKQKGVKIWTSRGHAMTHSSFLSSVFFSFLGIQRGGRFVSEFAGGFSSIGLQRDH